MSDRRLAILHSPRAVILLGSLLFALAYSQSPLFSTNQNTYFLHGLANAGAGLLRDDAIARSPDPFPVFSRLVELTHRHAGDSFFYVYYLLILALYAAACASIVDRIIPLQREPLRAIVYFAAFVGIHAVPLQHAAWFLQAGMAGQYVLGPVFQPSVFGVLLIVSIERFLRGRVHSAVLLGAAAATVHPSYVLGVIALTGAYVYRTAAVDRRLGKAAWVAVLSGALLVPIVLHTWFTFAPSSPEIARRAQEILVHDRLPHHALPGVWFGWTEASQVVVLCAGIFLARGTVLMPIMLVPLSAGLALTAGQMLTGSDRLALLFPWRVSVLLVPLSSILLLAGAIRRIHARYGAIVARRQRLIRVAATATIVVLAAIGVTDFLIRSRAHGADRRQLIEFVRTSLVPGDVYLIPPRWEDFRLRTGAPIFVDYKTHPYRDTDVVAWYERLKLAEAFYRGGDSARSAELRTRGVTHVVMNTEQAAALGPDRTELFRGNGYGVYRIAIRQAADTSGLGARALRSLP